MEEIWKDIPGYEGIYQVSNLGLVKSLPRVVLRHMKNGSVHPHRIYEKLLTPARQYRGHQQVCLCKEGVENHQFVHRLVLLAFVGPCPEGMEVCHNDSDPTNNRLDNLRYDTRSGNKVDSVKILRGPSQKLDPEQVLRIRGMIANGDGTTKIADTFGVATPTICSIKYGRSWAWLK